MNTQIKELLDQELATGEVLSLNTILSAEILETEAYGQAMQAIKDTNLLPELERCRNSHALAVEVLRHLVEELGGTPTNTAGFLGGVTKVVTGAAGMLSDKATIAVLAGGEDYCSQQYAAHLESLDSHCWSLVGEVLWRNQQYTEGKMNKLHSLQCNNENKSIH